MGPAGLDTAIFTLCKAVVLDIWATSTLQSEPSGSMKWGTGIVIIVFRGIIRLP
jgi:hypothetical protein